ncbi:enoyl-CoA hydratase/isomerase family protein [Cereibacter sphaeroides]|nr:enoyl-CoA hydratase/isomerase family protein [Cereibacter sphaeroides]
MGFDYQRRDDGIVVVTMDMDGQSANTMSQVYHDLMGATVARLEGEAGLKGVVIASAKKTFFAGGDLHALLANEGADAAYRAWLNEDKGFLRRLEQLGAPVVAAINGAALGGGLEICLACHHRVIVEDRAAVTGLPEVTLGLLPGAGGCARLPWLTGLAPALDLLLSGRMMAPAEALDLGVVDELVPTRDDLLPAALAWIHAQTEPPVQSWDRPVAPRSEVEMAKARTLLAETRARIMAETRGLLPGPLKIIELVEAGLVMEVDTVLALESRLFCDLLGLPETRAAITLNFFAANALRSGKLRPDGPRHRIEALEITGDGADALTALARKRRITVGPAPLKAQVTGDEILLGEAGEDPLRLHRSGPVVEIHAGAPAATARAYDLVPQLGLMPLVVRGAFLDRLRAALQDEVAHLLDEGNAPGALAAQAHAAGLDLTLPEGEGPVADDVTDRLLTRLSLEALTALAEGVLQHEAEADLASVQAAGFPRHLGGAVQYAREQGPDAFLARCDALADRLGDRFRPSSALRAYLRDAKSYAA